MVCYARPLMPRNASAATLLLVLFSGCSQPAPSGDPGALIDVELQSRAGVLLDEIPSGARERLVADLLSRPPEFWEARARRQVETTLYRLTYRNAYHEPSEGKGQLPLPPAQQWNLEVGAPERARLDGHDLVLVPYTFSATLLSPETSAALADPALGAVGGVVEEPFSLPADPEHLLERTGYACMNEEDFPPNSVDTENARQFFDDTCTASDPRGTEGGCHVSELVERECTEALREEIGLVEATARFTRVAWSQARADEVRVGEQTPGGAQLRALEEGVRDHRIIYRYFPADSCAISEGCVGGPGWRRLLQFTATVQNLGAEAAAIGDVGPDSLPVQNNMVSFSACHQHMHFNHYGRFTFGDGAEQLGGKRAFCLESTSRYFNNEDTPLTHPYGCHFQGVAAGWGDDYIAGLDCQWVDITPVESSGGLRAPLGFQVNPDDFLCEGTLRRDADGAPLFEPTEFRSEDGRTENRFQCDFFDAHQDDNVVSTEVLVPDTGGMVTTDCNRYLVGDRRNCGFDVLDAAPQPCRAGSTATLRCTGGSASAPATVRLCEASHRHGAIPCAFLDAVTTVVLDGPTSEATFTCPDAREAASLGPEAEVGGLVAAFVAPLVPEDTVAGVTCEVVP
jgi:hypothetical protein